LVDKRRTQHDPDLVREASRLWGEASGGRLITVPPSSRNLFNGAHPDRRDIPEVALLRVSGPLVAICRTIDHEPVSEPMSLTEGIKAMREGAW
jgi:hypothetical protein